jgi:hypothetical protein
MVPIRRFSQCFFVSLILVGSLATTSYASDSSHWILHGLTTLAKHLGPTGQAIIGVVVVLLVIGGIAYSLKKKRELKTKLALFQNFRQSPPTDRQQAVRDLVRCFLMGPVEFTNDQADHNAAVLESLCTYVGDEHKTTLQTYIAKFRARPAKFGMMESIDMEKWVGSLTASTDTASHGTPPASASQSLPQKQEGMAEQVDFDALARQAKDDPSDAKMDRLWRETFMLKQWHFIPRGEMPHISPFVGVAENKPFVFAFADKDKAREFSKKQGFLEKDGVTLVLSMPVHGFVQTVDSYASKGVFGLLFNDGPHGYFAPLHNVTPMHKHFQKNSSPGQSSSD